MYRWLLVLIATGCGQVIPSTDAAGMPEPGFKVVSFQELGLIPQASVIQGRDGARSAPLWGRSVWTFNTTVLNQNDVDGKNWHNSSFSTTDDLVGNDGVGMFTEKLDMAGAPVRLIRTTADEATYNANHAGTACPVAPCGAYYDGRPMTVVWDAARARALVFYELVFLQPGTESLIGSSVALWSALDGSPDRPMVSQGEHPTMLFQGSEPAFGGAAQVVAGDVYTLACAPDASRFISPCKLARVPIDDVVMRANWRFWDGAAFSSKLEDAADVFAGNWLLSVVWNAHVNRWLAVYSEPLTNVVMARTAAELTGPWSAQVPLFKTPAPSAEGWTYDAALHDEYTENGGETLYVSYSRPDPSKGLFGGDLVWVRVDIAATPKL
jgi:hypothetical protein